MIGVMSNTLNRYSPELKARAVRMYQECRSDYPSDTAAMIRVAELLGISSGETVRRWVHQVEVDQGSRPGVSTEEAAEMKRLKKENAELRRANAILKAASAFFAAEIDRPSL
jgi:transposase